MGNVSLLQYCRIEAKYFAPILSLWKTITTGLELATFRPWDKWLTPIDQHGYLHMMLLRLYSKHATWPGRDKNFPNWRGNIYLLVCKFFCLWCRKFSPIVWTFFDRSYPTIGTKNFHTRDNKFPHQRQQLKKSELFFTQTSMQWKL